MAHAPMTVYLNDRTKKIIKELAQHNQVSISTIVETAVRMFRSELVFQDKQK